MISACVYSVPSYESDTEVPLTEKLNWNRLTPSPETVYFSLADGVVSPRRGSATEMPLTEMLLSERKFPRVFSTSFQMSAEPSSSTSPSKVVLQPMAYVLPKSTIFSHAST